MKKLLLAVALAAALPMAALADSTISGPITFKSPSTTVTGSAVSVPTATTSVLGLVEPDGSTITISDGVISAAGGGGGSPASPFNSLQKNAAGSFGAAAVSDDGASLTATEPTIINVPAVVGAELLSNPDFVANDTGWTLGSADTAWSSGLFTTTCCTAGDETVSIDFASVAGQYYKITTDFTITGDLNYFYCNNNADCQTQRTAGPNQEYVFLADFTGTDTVFFDFYYYNPGAVRLMTGASVKELLNPGIIPLAVKSFNGDSVLSVDPVNGTVVLGGAQSFSPGPDGEIVGADALAGSNQQGTLLFVKGGTGDGTGQGGPVTIMGGAGGHVAPDGSDGYVAIFGSFSGAQVQGASMKVSGYSPFTGGGAITMNSGNSLGASGLPGGDITIAPGTGDGAARNGVVILGNTSLPGNCTGLPSQSLINVAGVINQCP